MSKIRIGIGEAERQAEAGTGQTLLEVLREAGAPIAAPCGGLGRCGKCRVRLTDAAGSREVLACQTLVTGDAWVETDAPGGGAILTESADTAAVDPGAEGLGAAVDLGTTTVVVELVDLKTGKRRGTESAWNAQAAYGADVITRAQYCMEKADGLETLHKVIRGQVDTLLRRLDCEKKDLKEIFVAGNTVMQHLFAGLDPRSIAVAPFTPLTLFDGDEPQEPGLAYAPCVAGYVGGDITAGLLASGLYEREERSLFLDIGTNGEMALGGRDGFLCCAVASGPAFEGAGIACGMTGVEGAVSHARFDGARLSLDVIGGGKPRGICGSGLIDLTAALCQKGIISAGGLLLGPDEAPEEFADTLGEDENGNGIFYLTEDRSVYLTARDVRQLQLAKAAVAAGIQVLLQKAGLTVQDVGRLYLAGGFGSYMDVSSAAAIGMLPAALVQKTVLLGNASLTGARMALLDHTAREKLRAIQGACRYLELSGDADFSREFPDNMYFYEEDEDEWN
ncbi:MAG: DUF4445 domain-containing protein [Oscillospiraceae bacterium]|nr:DUF4445 domain-containing protein [Oscillospiraceae bacterium]